MLLLGEVIVDKTKYYLGLKELSNADIYYLISTKHVDDLLPDTLDASSHVMIQDVEALKDYYTTDYLLEAVKKSRKSGEVQKFGKSSTLELVLDAFYHARCYAFKPENITTNKREVAVGDVCEEFSAKDGKVLFFYIKRNGSYKELSVSYRNISFSLHPVSFNLSLKGVTFTKAQKEVAKRIMLSTVKTVTYDDLNEILDMSWYKKDDVVLKNYSNVKTIEEFELQVMTPIVHYLQECKLTGVQAYISLDTEATGLKIYNLSKDNEALDHDVAVQVSWAENQGVTIFTDMEFFGNVPVEYVCARLQELFQDFQGERTITYYESCNYEDKDSEVVTNMSSFGENTLNCKFQEKKFTFVRKLVDLIGHNAPFDRRVITGEGYSIWFNEDTLQMAFNLDPKQTRGSKKLKVLTRRVFNEETPELSDVLGKGNEDKFRYLVNEEVAAIYGCADVDYTRKLFLYLRELTPDCMYFRYKEHDIPLLNILSDSEYYGMMTIPDAVEALAEETWQNLQILQHTMWEYVGVYMDYHQKMQVIEMSNEAGYYASESGYEDAKKSVTVDINAIYKFDFKASELRHVLYDIMKYPIFAYTEGKKRLPKVDKYVVEKLLKVEREEFDNIRELSHSVLRHGFSMEVYNRLLRGTKEEQRQAKSMELISAEVFNSKKYPLALILQKHSDLNKEYTSYYKPMREENLEGKLFKGYSMARIETRRISNPGQTMKGSLKANIRSYSDDYYTVDFDMSQIELRIMYSESKFDYMIEKMKNPESDSHIESAAMVNQCKAYKVTSKQRKSAKAVSFGLPYGLGTKSLCEKIFGDTSKEHLFETRMILHHWELQNGPIMRLLEGARNEALTEWVIDDKLREFLMAYKKDEDGEFIVEDGKKVPIPISKVTNSFGFYRTFSLENVDLTDAGKKRRATGKYDSVESSIRRASGNYPIQSDAAEIFRIILIRFYRRCIEEGIADKVIWHMLIHDELLCSVHKSVNPVLVYKIIKEACMITMKGHTKYFVGINIGKTWYECKDDKREAPVLFVDRMVKRYDAGEFREEEWFDDPWAFIKPHREQFITTRISEVLHKVQPSIDLEPINVPLIIEKCDNYTVRGYVNDYAMNKDIDSSDYLDADALFNATWQSRLETWALQVYGEGKEIIGIDGKLRRIIKRLEVQATSQESVPLFLDDYAEKFNDAELASSVYYSYEDGDVEAVYNSDIVEYEEEEYDFPIDHTKAATATNLAEMFVVEKKYSHLREIRENIIIDVKGDSAKESAIKNFLVKKKSSSGKTILFKKATGTLQRWISVSGVVDLKELDLFIGNLKEESSCDGLQNVCKKNNCIFLKARNLRQVAWLKEQLSSQLGEGAMLVFDTPFGKVPWKQLSLTCNVRELDKLAIDRRWC